LDPSSADIVMASQAEVVDAPLVWPAIQLRRQVGHKQLSVPSFVRAGICSIASGGNSVHQHGAASAPFAPSRIAHEKSVPQCAQMLIGRPAAFQIRRERPSCASRGESSSFAH